MDRLLFHLRRFTHLLSVRASLYALSATAAALAALAIGPYIPDTRVHRVGEETLEELLSILAASMLTVATFSMATLVTAFGAVTGSASPRAAALVLDDRHAQGAISTFIGAFIFSVVALIALGTGYFGRPERFVLFVLSLGVLGLVVVRLLRWVDRLSRLGRVGSAVDEVEAATCRALQSRAPYLGGRPAVRAPHPDAMALHAREMGHVQHVDMSSLQRIANREGWTVHLAVLPGAFTRPSRPILYVEGAGPSSDAACEALRRAVVIGDSRTYEQDPRFGLVVLGEVAGRALSPGINDPGTAIQVIRAVNRLLGAWGASHWETEAEVEHARVFVPALSAEDCFDDVFSPIERDGADVVEVGVALQKTFLDLSQCSAPGFTEAARTHSLRALARAETALGFEDDRERLREIARTFAAPSARAQA